MARGSGEYGLLIYAYLVSLIVGGVLLGASILLGGHDDADLDAGADVGGDADLDASAEVDVGLDASADMDASAEMDAGADVDGDAGHEVAEVGGQGDFSGFLLTFLSLRFWTFFLAFFGLTGIILDGLDLVSSEWLGLGLSLAMGLATGGGAMAVIRKLGSDATGQAVGEGDYIGKTARVMVPFEHGGVGKVRVDIKGSSVDLLATGIEESEDFDGKEEVLIVQMDGSRARVARVDGKKSRRES